MPTESPKRTTCSERAAAGGAVRHDRGPVASGDEPRRVPRDVAAPARPAQPVSRSAPPAPTSANGSSAAVNAARAALRDNPPPSRQSAPHPDRNAVGAPPRTPQATTPAPAAEAPSARITPRELLDHAGRLLSGANPRRTVFLVVQLNRSDRLRALAQDPVSRPVMLEVIRRVKSILRPLDRYTLASHDELWLLLVDLPSEALGELAARTLRESLSRPIHLPHENGTETTVQLRPSVGAAWTERRQAVDPMILLSTASEACQRARTRDDHVLIEKLESEQLAVDRNELEQALRKALHANELEVYFQPQVDLGRGRCVAVEALIRWTRPDGTMVSPALIAALCEERGMMGQLTQFVLNTSLRHLMVWKAQGIDVRVGINVSAISLSDHTFPALVSQALSTWGADPSKLTLELTESAIVENEGAALEFMNQLRAQGCHLAIDDFGTGYSSFAYLRQFPLNELKIDQMFVKNMIRERGDRRIVSALVDLAHTFEMRALAEGVEDAATAATLRQLGCDVAQGYFYSQAMPATKFIAWYRDTKDKLIVSPDLAVPR